MVAKPDEKWGEVPCAFVTLRADAPETTAAEIIEFCRQHLAHYKAPKQVIFASLPKTSTGKVQKYVLREQARRSADTEAASRFWRRWRRLTQTRRRRGRQQILAQMAQIDGHRRRGRQQILAQMAQIDTDADTQRPPADSGADGAD